MRRYSSSGGGFFHPTNPYSRTRCLTLVIATKTPTFPREIFFRSNTIKATCAPLYNREDAMIWNREFFWVQLVRPALRSLQISTRAVGGASR